ncbi:hypothetical protein HPC38_02525 [Pasteurellaceae bacterium HPA106]|uniref:hypothetical protein n=1 Tax=Spirabiliibacterium pneumoniae TaxID=221400 RepID=UPI001AAC96B7|nr:hypothetical protein [Spirabiliibacterium pneumoniae]MBE2895755.1 hypothetical protein [Spirabiliibacterium pneumoniae]
MSKNRLIDANDHLFTALERLNNEDLDAQQMEEEVRRASAIAGICDRVVAVNKLMLESEIVKTERLMPTQVLPPTFDNQPKALGVKK